MPKGIRASVITAAASMWTLPSSWRSTAPRRCLARSTPMCNRIPVRRQTRIRLKPGDTILGLSLAHGGHLTHGASVNASGKLYHAIQYGLNEKEEIDYDQVQALAMAHKPKMIVAGASAYALVIDWKRFRASAA